MPGRYLFMDDHELSHGRKNAEKSKDTMPLRRHIGKLLRILARSRKLVVVIGKKLLGRARR